MRGASGNPLSQTADGRRQTKPSRAGMLTYEGDNSTSVEEENPLSKSRRKNSRRSKPRKQSSRHSKDTSSGGNSSMIKRRESFAVSAKRLPPDFAESVLDLELTID